jgi:predicted dehydrogenase
MGAFTSEAVTKWAPRYWLPLSHAEAMVAHPGIALAALSDSDPEALERARRVHHAAMGFGDYREMLDVVRPDIVGLATRTLGRAEIIERCVAGGVRALHVEKPLCNSVAEYERLVKLFDREDLHVTLGAIRRFLPPFVIARDIAASGELGEIMEIRVKMGRRQLYWSHPHSVDLILFMAGNRRVNSVQARMSEFECGADLVIDADPMVEGATIWFEDGVAGHIGRGDGIECEICCERGQVVVKQDGGRLVIGRAAAENPYMTEHEIDLPAGKPDSHGTVFPLDQLAGCLADKDAALAANRVNKRDILLGQKLLFAMASSAIQGGGPIAFEQIDPRLTIYGKTGELYA